MLDAAAGASAVTAAGGGVCGAAEHTWKHKSPIRTAAVAWQQSAFMISPEGIRWGSSPLTGQQPPV